MSEWYDNQKKPSSDWGDKLEQLTQKNKKRRKLDSEVKVRLTKLERIAEQLRNRENMQNCQLQLLQKNYTLTICCGS